MCEIRVAKLLASAKLLDFFKSHLAILFRSCGFLDGWYLMGPVEEVEKRENELKASNIVRLSNKYCS